MAKQTINIGTTANDGTGDPIRSAFDKSNDNFTELYAGAGGVADDAITYAKLGTEFTTIQALTGLDVDWSAATIFTKTITATEALTFSNVETGKVIDLVLTGGTAVTLPTSVNVISGTYDPAVSNLIQITATNGSTEQWAVISKPAA